ncbi:MAG: DUF4394 domain-containing protein [Blastocatellia bacterium]|nr:DUF4394 domain-containing protein [Blastocatellia bacterium]
MNMQKEFFSRMIWSLALLLCISHQSMAQAPQLEASVWGLTASQKLVNFSNLSPGTIARTVTITGLANGETLIGIDFRPRNGQLLALSSANRMYTLNTTTGAATAVGTAVFTPTLNGAAFGVDFNPVPDRIRLVSDAEQNLRLNPDTGGLAGTDTTIAFATGDANQSANPNLVGAAYSNNVAGTTTTTMYAIDSNLDILVRQGSVGGAPVSPNAGQLFTIGALGVNTNEQVGFDIADFNDYALASLTATGATQSQLYSINLLTGAATLIGTIGGGEVIRGLAIAPTFAPTTQTSPITVANSASYEAGVVAFDSIASIFGSFQTSDGQPGAAAPGVALPTSLKGVSVTLNGIAVSLFYVSNSQINFLMPPGDGSGVATVVVTSSNGTTRTGTVNVVPSAPGIFTADSSGRGTATALTTFDGVAYQPITNTDGSERSVDPGTTARPNYLILYTTGVRRAVATNPNDGNGVAEAVTALIQGVPATVTYAGLAPSWSGLDQLNIVIPPELAGLGQLNVRLIVNGRSSNTTTFTIGGTPPQVRTQVLTPGPIVTGQLTPDDQIQRVGDGNGRSYFFDAYQFTANATTGVAIDLRSQLFDASILLYQRQSNGGLRLIAADDDTGGLGDGNVDNTDSLLLTVLPSGGEYVVFVTSSDDDPNATGAYTLRLMGNAIQPIGIGSTLNASIAASDLRTSGGDYLDAYWFAGVQGESIEIRMNSNDFDSYLGLSTNSGEFLADDDNSGGNGDSLLRATLPESGLYVFLATPYAVNVTGAYSLSLERLNSLSVPTAEAVAVTPKRRLPFGRIESAQGTVTPSQFERFATRRVVPQN